jgi:hypothetical protein
MGVPIDGSTYTYEDNQSVVKHTSVPEPDLRKMSNAIVYHALREAVAMKELIITYIPSKKNIADLMTKSYPVVSIVIIWSNVYHRILLKRMKDPRVKN